MRNTEEQSRGDTIGELLSRNVVDVIQKDYLEKRLNAGDHLRVKFGIDPTSPDLHLGHAVVLRILKRFQDLGNTIVLIIGDFTGMIGDPSGRSETRPLLTQSAVRKNMKQYLLQAGRILDIQKCEIHYNSEWYGEKNFSQLFSVIASYITLQQVLERDDFQKRMRDGIEISMLEAFYPLFQAYDSVNVKADVEIGGTDQKFNLLMGRKMQRRFGLPEQDIITLELLVGTDGVRKMSKSFGNTIHLTDAPADMFGKIMSIRDSFIADYYRKATDKPLDDIQTIERRLNDGALPRLEAKKQLAFDIVSFYHGLKKAKAAREYFEKTFQKRVLPEDAPSLSLHALSDQILMDTIKISKSELRRLVKNEGVEFEGKKVNDMSFVFPFDGIVRIGKKIFLKIKKQK